MFPVDRYLLITALLILVSVASSRVSRRVGLPVLVLFIVIGMAAGSEGLGIAFEDYTLAHGIGTVALAMILFDGGLSTSVPSIRPVLAPGVLMATVGVLATAGITGLVAYWLLDLSIFAALLLGSIVGSTDAAAVFATLRSSGLHLPPRVAATLELESGSNDPMAVFLTIGFIQVIQGELTLGAGLATMFLKQMFIGALAGWLVGRVAVRVLSSIELEAAGLYPVLTAALALLAYGLPATLGGSGFLSVYLAGIVVGHGNIGFKRGILLFHDGAAWLSQIVMFVLLGLLSSPSRLLDAAGTGLLIAAVLVVVARPLAVLPLLIPFRYRAPELAFMAFAGLKGAVPIVLGTYPLLTGLPGGEPIFDVVFFIVLTSALLQGLAMVPAARALGIQQPAPPRPPASLDITSLKRLEGDIVEYTVTEDSRVAGARVRELALPDGAIIAMIIRGERIIPPRGSTRLREEDHVFFVVTPRVRDLVERVFVEEREVGHDLQGGGEVPLRGSTRLSDLGEMYDLDVGGDDPSRTLDEVIRDRLGERVEVGRELRLGRFQLRVRAIMEGRVKSVGLSALPEEEGEDDAG